MNGKTLIQSPVTQTIGSGKALAQYLGIEEALPQIISLTNGARLTLSTKKDCYYFTNAKGCSCRAGQFGKECKHKRELLSSSSKAQAQAYQARQRELVAMAKGSSLPEPIEPAKRLARPPEDSIRPEVPAFRPFDLMPGEEKGTA
ncbi:hypothetical protein M0R72_18765 [Candidatus Pacearchaeota archaeon]|jgi:hypothetical protein|nr:hypothetical protein [Candidatus Pacearchaeota archaeon]